MDRPAGFRGVLDSRGEFGVSPPTASLSVELHGPEGEGDRILFHRQDFTLPPGTELDPQAS